MHLIYRWSKLDSDGFRGAKRSIGFRCRYEMGGRTYKYTFTSNLRLGSWHVCCLKIFKTPRPYREIEK